jgi:hypothetical protein
MNELARLRRKIVSRDAVPLVNTMVSIREEGGPPVRLYQSQNSVSPVNVHGTMNTDANGMIDIWVRAGLNLKIIAYSANRNELYRESIGGAYDLHADQAADDTVLNTPFQAGGSGGGGGGSSGDVFRTLRNEGSEPVLPGGPVSGANLDAIRPAIGNNVGKNVIGLYTGSNSLEPSSVGVIQIEGSLVKSIAEWQLVTDNVGGLVAGRRYYLDFQVVSKLRLSTSPPDGVSNLYVVCVGYALSTVEFKIEIQPPVRIS